MKESYDLELNLLQCRAIIILYVNGKIKGGNYLVIVSLGDLDNE